MESKSKNRKTYRRRRHATSQKIELVCIVLEDLLGKEVFYLRLIVQHLQISILQQLRPAIAQLLPNRLLYSRIVDIALPRRLARDQLIDGIPKRLLCLRVDDRHDVGDLPSLQ